MLNSMTLGEIYNELNEMGFISDPAILNTMTPAELKRFYKKAKKVYKVAMELEAEVNRRLELLNKAEE